MIPRKGAFWESGFRQGIPVDAMHDNRHYLAFLATFVAFRACFEGRNP